jgi:hypothetical protein
MGNSSSKSTHQPEETLSRTAQFFQDKGIPIYRSPGSVASSSIGSVSSRLTRSISVLSSGKSSVSTSRSLSSVPSFLSRSRKNKFANPPSTIPSYHDAASVIIDNSISFELDIPSSSVETSNPPPYPLPKKIIRKPVPAPSNAVQPIHPVQKSNSSSSTNKRNDIWLLVLYRK